jgi:succinate dehydrogenase / fumarate reductase cytochrome b subunit
MHHDSRHRPKNLKLASIRLPIPALVSILHRATGALIFLLLPLMLWTFQRSLASPESYQEVLAMAQHPLVKLMLLGVLWAFLHHFLAGIRHLTLDMRIGLDIRQARRTGKLVLIAGLLLTVGIGLCWW